MYALIREFAVPYIDRSYLLLAWSGPAWPQLIWIDQLGDEEQIAIQDSDICRRKGRIPACERTGIVA